MMRTLTIPRQLQERLVRWAKRRAPREICGALVGRRGRASQVIPARNVAPGLDSFYMDPRDLVAIWRYVERGGRDLLAFYHSHPRGPGIPSPRDIQESHYPEQAMVIIHPDDPARPIRAFALEPGVRELEVRRPVAKEGKRDRSVARRLRVARDPGGSLPQAEHHPKGEDHFRAVEHVVDQAHDQQAKDTGGYGRGQGRQ